jgi:antitoxin ParD1/3/4
LPESLWKIVDAAVTEGRAKSADAEIGRLIREEHKARRESIAELEALLQEGIDSGPPIRADESFWRERRERLLARHNQTTKPTRS